MRGLPCIALGNQAELFSYLNCLLPFLNYKSQQIFIIYGFRSQRIGYASLFLPAPSVSFSGQHSLGQASALPFSLYPQSSRTPFLFLPLLSATCASFQGPAGVQAGASWCLAAQTC